MPSGGGTSSTKSSRSSSYGADTMEYARSIPSDPIVQYWPGLKVKPSGFSSQMVQRSWVKSFLFSIVVSASFGRRTLLLVWVVKLELLLCIPVNCSVRRDLCGKFYYPH